MEHEKYIVITGGNRGIGYCVAERLLEKYPTAHLCLACRNLERAETAMRDLQRRHKVARIDVIVLDTSSVSSVFAAAARLREMFSHIDLLYFNAGIMPVTGVNWRLLAQILFSLKFDHFIHTMSTGHDLLVQTDSETKDGLREVFATNVFGHFVLFQELKNILGGDIPSRVLWTGSCNARRDAFQISDVQHRNGKEPYSSSKFATDILTRSLNDKYVSKNIRFYTTSPGLVITQLTYGIMPSFVWYLILPMLFLMRLLVTNLCLFPQNAAESLIYLSDRNQPSPGCKYLAQTSFTGHNYVRVSHIDGQLSEASQLYDVLDEMYREFKSSHS